MIPTVTVQLSGDMGDIQNILDNLAKEFKVEKITCEPQTSGLPWRMGEQDVKPTWSCTCAISPLPVLVVKEEPE